MRKLRDIVYVHANPNEYEFIYYGIEFKDFMDAIPMPIENMLLLEHNYWGNGMEIRSNLDTVVGDGINEFVKEDVYNFGDFCWVDFKIEESLDMLEPIEVAKLLYLGHMKKPIDSPFFEKIENRYAYCAHDDGWFCRLYCRFIGDFEHVIANKIISMVTTSRRRKIYPLTDAIKSQLIELSKEGLLIDFCNIMKNYNGIEIPIYTIGEFLDMDEMYNNLRRHVGKASYSARLVHRNKKWMIVKY